MDAVTERFGTGGLNCRQSFAQHRVEDVDHLAIAVISVRKFPSHPIDRGQQCPVLEGRSIA
jgi:hypothetical protein